ncbi:GNAT family N-acetyltransferase [Bacillus tianshenii]|uniref:GNAT family N-acetyltransferase n=1 Tax=Sutcliffiella tianshenii TaxID=1463404 RepID=UPI001CD28E1E|nr:GNAT family N-acetyltransferase [Bacillus tianshenii]MCA1322318.1 GNAT family N-acetyltransferase [Bacillus tianshenii]
MEFACVQNIKIRPLSKNDFKYILEWSKDETFCSANDWEKNRDGEELYKWWQHCVNNVSEDFIRLGIELEYKLIGYADLACIRDNTAELGIAIGESKLWGKGIGFNASICMIDYASKQLDINVFHAETHETNFPSRKMLERIGFKEVSRIGREQYLGTESQLIQYKLSL